ncbi:MAG: hypothetical protein AB7G11_11050 [Phycisphaerales bacterium]
MTADAMERLVLQLATRGYARWWRRWQEPGDDRWFMAVAVKDQNGMTMEVPELAPYRGGIGPLGVVGPKWFYVIPRTNDDGTPFKKDPRDV